MTRPTAAIVATLLAVVMLWLGTAPPAAASGVVGDPVAICIARAAPRLSARALFASPDRFDCTRPQTSWGPGDYHALSAPISAGRNWPVTIRTASLWQDRTTLHALYADGTIATIVADSRALTRHIQLGAIVEWRLPVRGVPVVRLLWHIEGASSLRGIVLGAAVATPSESAASNLTMAALYAGFGGLGLALLIYNLALWGALRRPFQLAYCAMVTTLLVYAFSSSGALAWVWPGIANNDRLRLNIVALALSAVAALAFARSFFGRAVFAGWLGRAASVVSALLVATALLYAILLPFQARLLDLIYAAAFVALIALVAPILWRAWRLRRNYLWLFAIAWATPIAFASLRIAAAFGLIPWGFWLDHSTVLAMALEASLSSLALAYRIRLLSRERDAARANERVARALADIDPLTGLLNRRAFLREAIGREGAHTLLLCDMDHFKRVNETIGHDGGDEVLCLFARLLRDVAGDGLVTRLGGEEFAILTRADRAPAPALIQDALRAERMPFDLAVTVSIGTTTGVIARETDWKTLYGDADRALFAAKAAGRDRVRVARSVSHAA